MSLSRQLFPVLFMLAVAGCDESFTPIEPSELQFSVFGFLDASADTQWIRVMPIRPVIVTSPAPPGIRATLEHLGTGRIIEMRDTVIRYTQHNPGIGSEGVYLNHAWTTEPIEPGGSYRFSAQRDGKRAAEAVVQISPDFDVEVWIGQGGRGDLVQLAGVPHVAFVWTYTNFYDGCGSGVQVDRSAILPSDSDVQQIRIGGPLRRRDECGDGPQLVENRDVWLVGSGAPWPAGLEDSPYGLALPGAPTNVSHAVGFLGGVLTKVVPYEECHLAGSAYCVLRYDESSARLSGTITDATCMNRPVPLVTVRLQELDSEPGRGPIVRIARTTRTGEYRMGALEAGKRYSLSIRRLRLQHDPPIIPTYGERTDTLVFAPGDDLRYDVALTRFDPC